MSSAPAATACAQRRRSSADEGQIAHRIGRRRQLHRGERRHPARDVVGIVDDGDDGQGQRHDEHEQQDDRHDGDGERPAIPEPPLDRPHQRPAATTMVVAQTRAGKNGWTIQNDAAMSPPMKSTARVTRVRSNDERPVRRPPRRRPAAPPVRPHRAARGGAGASSRSRISCRFWATTLAAAVTSSCRSHSEASQNRVGISAMRSCTSSGESQGGILVAAGLGKIAEIVLPLRVGVVEEDDAQGLRCRGTPPRAGGSGRTATGTPWRAPP